MKTARKYVQQLDMKNWKQSIYLSNEHREDIGDQMHGYNQNYKSRDNRAKHDISEYLKLGNRNRKNSNVVISH